MILVYLKIDGNVLQSQPYQHLTVRDAKLDIVFLALMVGNGSV